MALVAECCRRRLGRVCGLIFAANHGSPARPRGHEDRAPESLLALCWDAKHAPWACATRLQASRAFKTLEDTRDHGHAHHRVQQGDGVERSTRSDGIMGTSARGAQNGSGTPKARQGAHAPVGPCTPAIGCTQVALRGRFVLSPFPPLVVASVSKRASLRYDVGEKLSVIFGNFVQRMRII